MVYDRKPEPHTTVKNFSEYGKLVFEPMTVWFTDAYMRYFVSMS